MKAKWILLACMSLVLLLGSGVFAVVPSGQPLNSYDTHVFVHVNPTISVGADPTVTLHPVGLGTFTGKIHYKVDANTQEVRMWVEATNLVKADRPIPVAGEDLYEIPTSGSGVHVDADYASPLGGGTDLLKWEGAAVQNPDTGWKWRSTEAGVFTSNQRGRFSQGVDVAVDWDQSNPELPMGDYSGWVRLTAEIVMPSGPQT